MCYTYREVPTSSLPSGVCPRSLHCERGLSHASGKLERASTSFRKTSWTVTDMNSYPPTAEAVDGHLAKAIDTLQRSTEQGIGRIETRIGEMATKDAVEAHVARLDQRDDHLESRMDAGFDSVKSDMSKGFSDVATRDAERDAAQEKREVARAKAAEKRDEERDKKFARRMTWTLTVVGLGFTGFQLFVAPYIGG